MSVSTLQPPTGKEVLQQEEGVYGIDELTQQPPENDEAEPLEQTDAPSIVYDETPDPNPTNQCEVEGYVEPDVEESSTTTSNNKSNAVTIAVIVTACCALLYALLVYTVGYDAFKIFVVHFCLLGFHLIKYSFNTSMKELPSV